MLSLISVFNVSSKKLSSYSLLKVQNTRKLLQFNTYCDQNSIYVDCKEEKRKFPKKVSYQISYLYCVEKILKSSKQEKCS